MPWISPRNPPPRSSNTESISRARAIIPRAWSRPFGRQCLIARRVGWNAAFASSRSTTGWPPQQQNWDAHNGVEENLQIHGRRSTVRSLHSLGDLEQRGLPLDSTLVVWEGNWTAGGLAGDKEAAITIPRDSPTGSLAGCPGGTSYGRDGRTRARGRRESAPRSRLHATIPASDGTRPLRLTYFYGGLERKLTGVVEPEIIRGVLA